MAKAQILVADRDPGFAGGVAANLESLGYAVAGVASSPEETWKKAEEAQPDLVLLDLGMVAGGKRGIVPKRLQESLQDRLIYVVEDEDREAWRRAKITHSFDYLRKTCDTRELETIIDMALYRRQLEGKIKRGQAARGRDSRAKDRRLAEFQVEKKEQEVEVQRVNRALRTLSSVNKAVVRAETEAELLQNVCRVVVQEGGYRLAWIGYAEDDRDKTVRPVAQAGYEEGYLETLKITWADTERGRGPTGLAIRTGQPALARNILTDPHFAPWQQEASKRGYASSLVLPLLVDGQAFGALSIYAGEADAFDTAEVQLLSDLAADVSYGIMALRGREERRRMAAALRRSYEELEARVQDRTQELAHANAALQMEIAERLWSEKKLQESEERYRSLVNLSPDGIAVQSQGRYLFINPAGARLFGAADPREMVGQAVPELTHPAYRQLVTEHICKVNTPGARTDLQEIKILRLDGREVDVEASGVGITYQGQAAVQVVLRDVTARKRTERKLKHLASFPQLNPDPVLEADISGSITYANWAAMQILEELGLKNQTRAFLPPGLDQLITAAAETGQTISHYEIEIGDRIFSETVDFVKEFKVFRIYGRDITQRKQAEIARQELLKRLQASEEELQATVEELQVQAEELQVQAEEVLEANQNLNEAHSDLQEREAQLRAMFDSLTEGLVVADLEGHLLHWNPAAIAMHGFASLEECRRRLPEFTDIFELSTLEDGILPLADWPLVRILRGETLRDWEVHLRRHGTDWHRVFNYGGTLARDLKGEPLLAVVTVSDITARKAGEEALRESRKDLNRAQAVAHTGSWRLNVHKNELLWSDETYRIFGISPGTSLTYESFLAAVHPEDRDYVDQQWLAAIRGESYDIEHRIVVGDTVKWVRERAELEFDPQGQLRGGFGTVQDITGRKEAETALQTSRDFLEIANRHTAMAPLLQDYVTAVKEHTGCEAAAIRILDAEGNIPYEAFTGFSQEFVASESPLCIMSDKCLCINVVKGAVNLSLPCYTRGSSCYINNFSQVLAATPPGVLGETRNVCHQFGYESVALIPIVFGGNILGLIHLADHRENMVPLSLVERLERIALTLGTAINRVRAEEGMHQALTDSRRRQAEIGALLQATRAVLEARTFPEVSRSIFDYCKDLIEASSGYIALLTADGQENDILFLDSGGLSCQVDPSLPMPIRGLREEAYRTGRTVYHNDFAHSDYAQFLPPGHVGLDNVLFAPLVVKGKAVGLLGLGNKPGGYTPNDARLAAGFGELAAMALVNKRAEEEREGLIRELETERARLQAIIASAPEAIVVADASGHMVMANPAADLLYTKPSESDPDLESCTVFQLCHADGSACVPGDQPLLRSATAGETYRNLEMILTWADGQRRDLLVNTAPLKDHQGRSNGAVGLFQDITQRKQVEEKIRNLNAELNDRIREVSERTLQLEAANKELEAFSYSVSHDLRAPLRAIEGFASILLEEHGEKLAGEGVRLLNVIRSNTRIMGELIDDLLALSRLGRQEIRAQKIDLGGLVTSVFGELRAQAPERQMQLILNPLPPAYGDRSLINQVLVNLLGNAVKFTQSEKNTIIEVGGWTEGKEDIYFVKDNGVGFDMRYVDKIFGVFQRLHRREEFDGTGVGLAIVQRIINRHGGRIWATGKVDGGAAFYFALPHKGD